MTPLHHLHGENLFFISFLWLGLIIAEHENVAAGRVSMKVTVKEYIAALQRALHHQLRVVVDRVEFRR